MSKLVRFFSILTVLLMLFALVSCAGQETTAGTTKPGATTAAATTTVKEDPIVITDGMDSITWNDYQDSPIAQYLLDKFNIIIEMVDITEQKEALMASGDLPDFFIIGAEQRGSLIESGFIIDMNDLVEQYGPDIEKNAGLALDFLREYWSDGSGALYGLPGGNTYEPIGYGILPADFGLNLNWSLYEQLGYPEVTNNWDSVLSVVEDMVALQPTTADGLAVYGLPAFSAWGMWGHVLFSITLPGSYSDMSVWSMVLNNKTLELTDNYTDPQSPLWNYVEFLYQENQLGIFDTDSLIASWEDLGTKAANGQYVGGMWGAMFSSANSLMAVDNNGYATIPVTNGGVWGGSDWRYGQKNLRCISANAEHPEKVIEFLNFCYSTEGNRILNSGIEGVHWDYIDGVPNINEETATKYKENGIAWKETGIGYFTNYLMASFLHEDGFYTNLFYSKQFNLSAMNDFQKKVANHYGMDTQLEYFQAKVDSGDMISQAAVDRRIGNMMPILTDDLNRIKSEADAAMVTGIAQCILSANDSEYEANKTALIEQVKTLGIETVTDWFREQYETLGSTLPPKE
ncbi:MAG TPA: hypothetical protein DD640_06640 [Clostridiales bacterium]|nr:hypothetical protein [Clostridiales bacterium]